MGKRAKRRPSGDAVSVKRHARLGPLDRLLVNAVVDTKQGVDGALDEDALHAAVDEFVNLNGRRHQSHHHAGFRDAIFDRPMVIMTPANNVSRGRWYWTGAVLAWTRTERWQRIVQALDEDKTMRGLGDGVDRPSRTAGIWIANALWKTGRTAELATFVGKDLARRPSVFRLLLDAGTEALRKDEVGIARQVFELLMDCTETEGARKVSSDVVELARTVRRRMAHCLRLRGEHRRAEELLQALLEDDPGANDKAMVHADLGLLKGHFLLLDDVRIPSEREARQNIVERLRAGENEFDRAVAIKNSAYAAHGHYCLGVLALADDAGEELYKMAHRHLDQAQAHFKSARANYPPSLVAQTDLYLGIAKAQLLTAGDIEHAGRLIVEGLQSSAQMPTYLIRPTIDALSISKSAIENVASLLLETDSDEALDALARVEPEPELAPVAQKLYERANLPHKNRLAKAEDLRGALNWFLRLDESDKRSSDVLDELETLAVSGVSVEEFIKLLSDPSGYDPAWTKDDAATASARCLEARGDYEGALATLRPVFHRHMSKSELDNAVALLEWVRTLGLQEGSYADLDRRYSAAKEQSAEPQPTQRSVKHIAVLVVGGDESHAKRKEDVIKRVQKQDAAVSVEFTAIDWTANWNTTLEDVRRKLPNVGAVVLMRFMRTTFGQHVRKLCSEKDIPWRFCYGGGVDVRARAVLRAADAARSVPPPD